mmetsp:Transcript_21354/g.36711  ORF Transcript_21354/g.36711 Transcript_21354/m.36711 type:complete len:265 (+) Transcript_21354:95-889(+)
MVRICRHENTASCHDSKEMILDSRVFRRFLIAGNSHTIWSSSKSSPVMDSSPKLMHPELIQPTMNGAYMTKLPNEVWERILLRLVLKDLHEFSLTNKHFHSLIQVECESDTISIQCVNLLMYEYPETPRSYLEDRETPYQAAISKAPAKWKSTWAQAKAIYICSQETAYSIHSIEEALLCYAAHRFRHDWAIISIFMAQMVHTNQSLFRAAVSGSENEPCALTITEQRPSAHWRWIYSQFIDLNCVRMHRVKSILRSLDMVIVF